MSSVSGLPVNNRGRSSAASAPPNTVTDASNAGPGIAAAGQSIEQEVHGALQLTAQVSNAATLVEDVDDQRDWHV